MVVAVDVVVDDDDDDPDEEDEPDAPDTSIRDTGVLLLTSTTGVAVINHDWMAGVVVVWYNRFE